ncbi:GNAT family N-acetyltransferase [Oxalobacteraceae bacterium OM1]|nr:GNAT family N-acetyltransferase [Oxalobacteraceae bacterium OM1]
MNYLMTLGEWDRLSDDARTVRYDVFVQEQKVPVELEWDDMDAVSLHAVVYDEEDVAIGTGRLLPDGHIGRMAVRASARGHGIGGAILRELMLQAKARGDSTVILNAQTQAEPFYQRYGFARSGEEFMEAGIPHVEMRHTFSE